MTRATAVPATEHKPEHTTEYSCTKVVHVTVTDTRSTESRETGSRESVSLSESARPRTAERGQRQGHKSSAGFSRARLFDCLCFSRFCVLLLVLGLGSRISLFSLKLNSFSRFLRRARRSLFMLTSCWQRALYVLEVATISSVTLYPVRCTLYRDGD